MTVLDIASSIEQRVYHERLKEDVTALKRLEERERKDAQSGTNASPLFTALHPALRGSGAETRIQHKSTKGTKNQRVYPSSDSMQALEQLATGRVKGEIVITID